MPFNREAQKHEKRGSFLKAGLRLPKCCWYCGNELPKYMWKLKGNHLCVWCEEYFSQ